MRATARPARPAIFASTSPGVGELLTPELREQLREQGKDAPWFVRVVMQAALDDPAAFRARLFTTMARVFFAMLPVFAGIVALFYRRWTFPVSLVFATHLHAFAFVALTITEAAKLAGSRTVELMVGVPITIGLAVYAIVAFRRVFGGGLVATLGKAAAIGVIYLLTSLPAFFVILIWAAVS